MNNALIGIGRNRSGRASSAEGQRYNRALQRGANRQATMGGDVGARGRAAGGNARAPRSEGGRGG